MNAGPGGLATLRLTEANIKKLQAPERGNSITYDDEIPGGLRVTAANARAFVLGYSINGRKRRMSIGRWPVWTATAARARAKQLRRMIDLGQDPLGKRQARRGEPTFAQIAAEYLKRHAARKKSGYRDEAWLRNDVLPEWGPLKASESPSPRRDSTHRGESRDGSERCQPPAGYDPHGVQLRHRPRGSSRQARR